jgi:hypothetical protein
MAMRHGILPIYNTKFGPWLSKIKPAMLGPTVAGIIYVSIEIAM